MYNYNPYQAPTHYYGPQPTQLTKVNGLDGAKAYQMAPNSMAALFDINTDTFFIKTTDGAGFPQIRIFSFTQKQDTQTQPYITRKQYDEIQKQIAELKEMIQDGKQPVFGSID